MWLTRFQPTVAASGEREGLERCGSPGFNPQSPRLPTDFTGMYPVPAPSRAYHPCFTRDSVQAILVVPQGRAIVNSKPYPACLFFWRGRPSTDAPGVQISILQRRRRKHLHQCQVVKSGTPPHQLNRRRYGAGILSSAFRGRRPVEYPRNTSGVQSPDSKRRIVLLLAEPTRKKPRRQQENVLRYEFSWP